MIATQNPVEFTGTYPLPEAQMDRFALHFRMGYVSAEEESAILTDQMTGHPIDTITSCATVEDILSLRRKAEAVRIGDELKEYIVTLVADTRTAKGVELGASPRASIALMKASQASAMIDNMEYVTPDHIQQLAIPVIAHRLIMDSQAKFSGRTPRRVVEKILEKTKAPA